ncbi:hypothetical protein PPL_06015 [Heterostelium album PN500]|uniref:Uncharacterized protein n=1 Tax=Heterostelium pallidum (strain ATCC 26659 / Pp 5 / PN500) TaxID=670386 RepID=D3BBZ5_HETP5|nr:hypothetical protein PPL_06015 [Heterostelium album PN500]EFA81178.1 hypothetical protein PPL_06015 [Heterostelium album PN500]|eukprot:XP_020433296.1 hypothetical protein PPL_06015 [Heterostelium album PN500]
MSTTYKIKELFFFNNTWKFTLNSKDVSITIKNQSDVEINGLIAPSIYNSNLLRLEFIHENQLFYITHGNALPLLGMNKQLYMNHINIINGRQYHTTPLGERIFLLVALYFLGVFCWVWALIPAAVYSVGLYLFFRHRSIVIRKLPSELQQFQGPSQDQSQEPLISYETKNPVMTHVLLPFDEKLQQFRQWGSSKSTTAPTVIQTPTPTPTPTPHYVSPSINQSTPLMSNGSQVPQYTMVQPNIYAPQQSQMYSYTPDVQINQTVSK